MNIIEQIDARFTEPPVNGSNVVHITELHWQQIKAELAKVRGDALEEAAKACDEISDKYYQDEHRRFPELKTDAEAGADDCANRIRALKDGE